jgi:PII interaction protein X
MLKPILPDTPSDRMNTEEYLDHPSFGLLYKICLVEESRAIFATLYAQRLFFVVSTQSGNLQFEAIGRADAKIMIETRLRDLRRTGPIQDYDKLQIAHKQTFQM